MILVRSLERYHYGDRSHFTKDKDEDIIRLKTVRSYCLDLLSSLVEVFGDLAVEAILYVIDNICLQNSQGSESPTKMTKIEIAKTVEEINIYEFTYTSRNKKHIWKKKEVAFYLIGSFAEDISMYR